MKVATCEKLLRYDNAIDAKLRASVVYWRAMAANFLFGSPEPRARPLPVKSGPARARTPRVNVSLKPGWRTRGNTLPGWTRP